jgi:hypothetical protein
MAGDESESGLFRPATARVLQQSARTGASDDPLHQLGQSPSRQSGDREAEGEPRMPFQHCNGRRDERRANVPRLHHDPYRPEKLVRHPVDRAEYAGLQRADPLRTDG